MHRPDQPMELGMREAGDTLVLTVPEHRIDALSAIRFKDAMRGVLSRDPSRVLLDLSRVQFIDSSGLGAIVAARKLFGPERPLELAGLTPIVRKVFALTQLDSVFVIHACTEDGLAPPVRSANA